METYNEISDCIIRKGVLEFKNACKLSDEMIILTYNC